MSSFNVMSSFTIDFSKIARGHFCGDFRSLYDIFRFLQLVGNANAATAGFGMLTDSVRRLFFFGQSIDGSSMNVGVKFSLCFNFLSHSV